MNKIHNRFSDRNSARTTPVNKYPGEFSRELWNRIKSYWVSSKPESFESPKPVPDLPAP